MIIEEQSDLNITASVIPKSRSSKRTLKASLMENSASPPFSLTLQFPDKLLGCKLRFRFRRAVVWRHEVMYRSPGAPLLRTLGEIAARQCPGFRWNVIIENSEMWAIVGIASDRGSLMGDRRNAVDCGPRQRAARPQAAA
jgi:hypothetical protein